MTDWFSLPRGISGHSDIAMLTVSFWEMETGRCVKSLRCNCRCAQRIVMIRVMQSLRVFSCYRWYQQGVLQNVMPTSAPMSDHPTIDHLLLSHKTATHIAPLPVVSPPMYRWSRHFLPRHKEYTCVWAAAKVQPHASMLQVHSASQRSLLICCYTFVGSYNHRLPHVHFHRLH